MAPLAEIWETSRFFNMMRKQHKKLSRISDWDYKKFQEKWYLIFNLVFIAWIPFFCSTIVGKKYRLVISQLSDSYLLFVSLLFGLLVRAPSLNSKLHSSPPFSEFREFFRSLQEFEVHGWPLLTQSLSSFSLT